jgi:hypothetical protein
MGERHEDRVDVVGQFGVNVEIERGQVLVDAADRVVVAAAPRQADEIDIGVSRQEPDQLAPDISRRTDDPDPDAPGAGGRVEAALRAWSEGGCHDRMTIQQ